MSSFSDALKHLKEGGVFIQRSIVKNETKIQEYKGRLYHNVLGVRAPYRPTNEDLFAEDWIVYFEDGRRQGIFDPKMVDISKKYPIKTVLVPQPKKEEEGIYTPEVFGYKNITLSSKTIDGKGYDKFEYIPEWADLCTGGNAVRKGNNIVPFNPKTPEEALELCMLKIKSIENRGVKVVERKSSQSTDKRLVEKYNKPERLKPENWVTVDFFPKNKDEWNMIFQAQSEMAVYGVYFDTSAGKGERNWQMDWAFQFTKPQYKSPEPFADQKGKTEETAWGASAPLEG